MNIKLMILIPAISFNLISKNIIDLSKFEKKVFSQNGEDGVILKIFDLIGVTNKYYVEFGTQNCQECNTKFLRDNYKWTGLLMDGSHENKSINLYKEFITAENINSLFHKYKVPKEFDLLSIDIDFNDFYAWNSIDSSKYNPRVVVIEYNSSHLPQEDKIVIYNSNAMWDGTNYFGASILALTNLAKNKGYTLVYADKRGINLFFIRNDILKNINFKIKDVGNINKIYNKPGYGNNGHPKDPLNRHYVSSNSILKN